MASKHEILDCLHNTTNPTYENIAKALEVPMGTLYRAIWRLQKSGEVRIEKKYGLFRIPKTLHLTKRGMLKLHYFNESDGCSNRNCSCHENYN
jgi:predicted transcriptional regulator